jgi:nucleoside-diphosphate-sugar epimerase
VRMLVTGAGGFIGRALTRALAGRPEVSRVLLLDAVPPPRPADPRFELVAADLTLTEPGSVLEGIDCVIHLASVPGGTAEAEPRKSRQVNVDATLALLEHLEASPARTRFVYASTIAVLGEHAGAVSDATPLRPSLTYGAHKLMAETALADFHRRGHISGISLRLPGIVARPKGASGLRSAFMSEIFHAAAAREPFTLPVGPEASFWLMSAACAARNLVHAAFLPTTLGEAVTLPALRVTARELVAALYGDQAAVRYEPDADLQTKFGAMPLLSTPAAEALGFAHDGTLQALVAATRSAA